MNYPDFEFRKAVAGTPAKRTLDLPELIKPRPEAAVSVKAQIEQAQQELARLKELDAATQQRDRIVTRIANERALAEATQTLLACIRQLVVEQARSVNGSKLLSRFIKELQPLAQTYGVKIVKVGNGELATLVLTSAK